MDTNRLGQCHLPTYDPDCSATIYRTKVGHHIQTGSVTLVPLRRWDWVTGSGLVTLVFWAGRSRRLVSREALWHPMWPWWGLGMQTGEQRKLWCKEKQQRRHLWDRRMERKASITCFVQLQLHKLLRNPLGLLQLITAPTQPCTLGRPHQQSWPLDNKSNHGLSRAASKAFLFHLLCIFFSFIFINWRLITS